MRERALSPENEQFVKRVIQAIHLDELRHDGVMPVTILLPDSSVSPAYSCRGVDNVCDWYYSAPEDRPRVCPTCGEEFE